MSKLYFFLLLSLMAATPAVAGDTPRKAFEMQAWEFSLPNGLERMNAKAVRENGAGCVQAAYRTVAFSDDGAAKDSLGAAWVGSDCSHTGDGVVAITLGNWGTDAVLGERVLVTRPGSQLIMLYGLESRDDQIKDGLEALIAADPFRGGALPEWPSSALTPDFATGLVLEASVDRELYLAVRQANVGVWCFPPHQGGLTCFAAARGRSAAIELFTIGGLRPYEVKSAGEAVDVLTGRRPALSPEAYQAKEAAQLERLVRAAESLMGL